MNREKCSLDCKVRTLMEAQRLAWAEGFNAGNTLLVEHVDIPESCLAEAITSLIDVPLTLDNCQIVNDRINGLSAAIAGAIVGWGRK